ncbi:MAG: AtpZ/AtpI family protein [Pirellulales bacterium]|nr:AtpZ/AtpI family protein [Pirellulales bacterium]
MNQPHNDYSPLVQAMQWSSRITTIALEMCLPPLAGYWLDRRLSSGFVFLLVGACLGFAVSISSLLRLARGKTSNDRP